MLGSVKAVGLTERELEQELMVRLQEAEILPRPIVLLFTQSRRARRFTILGGVTQPGPYPVTDPDMRLLDGIGLAGDISPTAQMVYVIRREDSPITGVSEYPARSETGVIESTVEGDEETIIPPPPEPPGSLMSAVGLARGLEPPPETNAPVTRDELGELLAPQPTTAPKKATTRQAPLEEPFAPIIFDPQTGEVLEAPAEAAPGAVPAEQMREEELRPEELEELEELEEPFEWESVEDFALDQRVIGIPVAQLRGGDPRYNIVLRNRDVVNVPVDTGAFYAMGEVNRPGVYSFGGRDITIKQAIAIVGGFTPLAWPQRCEIIRREPGTDKQVTYRVDLDAIFSGRTDDFYLRDDDIVNVGTHVVAPFLFVLRNSFRFTYGFGFVYDRNFADKDAYSSRTNPEVIAQQKAAQRGLSF